MKTLAFISLLFLSGCTGFTAPLYNETISLSVTVNEAVTQDNNKEKK